MATLIILEALINWLGRGKRQNLADSVTSISFGLVMTMLGLLSKGACISLYSWVHTHYRVVDLPWDSVWTWVLTAVLVDLGYYWFHRASHEIGALWAVHQVHHGSNRYCLDKNYGGFLSIWDRIFGTFQDLRPDEQTVYGLVDQPKFFNVVKHQLFYFPALLDKVPDGTWSQKIAVFFMGPGWFPGLPRMGDNNLVPEIPQREKHFTSLPLLAHLYLAVQVAACFVLHDDLSRLYPTMSQGAVLVIMGAILSTLTTVSLHYDHSPLALPMEILRCSIGLALVMVTGGWKAGTLSATALSVWLGSSFSIAVVKSFVASGTKQKEA